MRTCPALTSVDASERVLNTRTDQSQASMRTGGCGSAGAESAGEVMYLGYRHQQASVRLVSQDRRQHPQGIELAHNK